MEIESVLYNSESMKSIFKRKFALMIPVLLIVGGSLAASVYFYQKYQKIKADPETVAKEEVLSATSAISRFMELPKDEEPTLATVTDQEKLKDQEFFKNAQNGDKVLIYTNARKAILYRPSSNKVIEFAPLTLGGDTQAEPVKVAIYNGTSTQGLTSEYEQKLGEIGGLNVVSKTNASKNDYTKAIVVDLSGNNQEMAKQIAEALSGDISDNVPDGESRPEADILVIAGQ